MKRFIYALVQGCRHSARLRQPNCVINALRELPLGGWQQQGKRAIVFDFDGVLAAHGASAPSAEGEKALVKALSFFPRHVFILSNKPLLVRERYFQTHFPSVHFITAKKKPYPQGLERIADLAACRLDQLVLIDDRMLTGGLACAISGATWCYLAKPAVDWSLHPFSEGFFCSLRCLERFILR